MLKHPGLVVVAALSLACSSCSTTRTVPRAEGSTSPSVGAEPAYTVVDLGPGHAVSINNTTHVGGYGFVWNDVRGRQETGMGWCLVNDSGSVAGTYNPGDTDSRPCIWNATGGVTDLGEPGKRGWGTAINNAGVVSCWYGVGNGLQAFVWEPDKGLRNIHQVLPLPDDAGSVATDINDAGRILIHTFDNGSFIVDGATDEVTPIGPHRARAFNEHGDVVFSNLDAMRTRAGELVFFSTPPGYSQCHGRGINNKREVVGICVYARGVSVEDWSPLSYRDLQKLRTTPPRPTGWQGFVWTEAGGFRLLNDLIDPSQGWHIEYADDINDDGRIVGAAQRNGESRAVLLVPLPPTCEGRE